VLTGHDSVNRRLARSSVQTAALLGLRTATQAFLLVLLTRLLNPEVYGNLAAIASLALALGALPALGSGYILLARSARDDHAAADVWRYTWPLILALGLFLLVCFVGVARLITDQGKVPLSVLLWIGVTELLITPLTTFMSSSLQALERVPLSQFIQWLPLGLRLLAVAPCFLFTDELRLSGYAGFQFVAAVIGVFGAWAITRKYLSVDWRPRRASLLELKEGATYATMQLIASNPTELDKIMAVRAVGAYDSGIYSSTSRVMGALVTPVVAMLLASQPRLFRHAYAPTLTGKRLIVLIALVAFTWGAMSGIALAVCSPALPILFGSAYGKTADLLPVVAIVAPFLSLRLAAGTVLVALGKPFERIGFELAGLATLLVGTLILPSHFGLRGYVSAVILAEATMASIGWILVIRRHRSDTFANAAA
jgi:O-antigen/teichoic acid export membrane protein